MIFFLNNKQTLVQIVEICELMRFAECLVQCKNGSEILGKGDQTGILPVSVCANSTILFFYYCMNFTTAYTFLSVSY